MAIQLYKRINDKFSPEKDSKDPNKQKWNGDSACVKIDGKYVSLSKLAKLANAYIPVQKVENEIEIDGANHDINELIGMYRASKQNFDDNSDKNDPALQAGIKGMKKFSSKKNKDEEDMDEKENEVAGAKESNKDVVMKENDDAGEEELEKGEEGAKKVVTQKGKNKKMKDNDGEMSKNDPDQKKENEEDVEDKDEEMKKNKEEDEEEEMKENETDEDEDTKEMIRKQSKNNNKDVRHFIRLNTARENGSAEAGILTIDTMHNRVGRGSERYGSTIK